MTQSEKDLLNRMRSDRLNPREESVALQGFGLQAGTDGMEMTQKEVADLLGISQSYISRLEKKIMKRLKKEIVQKEGAAAKEVSKVSFCSSSRRLRYVSGFSVKAFVDHVTEGVCIGLVRQIPSSHQVILDQFKPLQLQLFPESQDPPSEAGRPALWQSRSLKTTGGYPPFLFPHPLPGPLTGQRMRKKKRRISSSGF